MSPEPLAELPEPTVFVVDDDQVVGGERAGVFRQQVELRRRWFRQLHPTPQQFAHFPSSPRQAFGKVERADRFLHREA